jgi:DNA-binding CsgD family transcriptional regulator
MGSQSDEIIHLSPYSTRVITLASEGLSSQEIADKIGCKAGAIDQTVYRLLKVVGVKNRTGLVAWYLKNPTNSVRNLTAVS